MKFIYKNTKLLFNWIEFNWTLFFDQVAFKYSFQNGFIWSKWLYSTGYLLITFPFRQLKDSINSCSNESSNQTVPYLNWYAICLTLLSKSYKYLLNPSLHSIFCIVSYSLSYVKFGFQYFSMQEPVIYCVARRWSMLDLKCLTGLQKKVTFYMKNVQIVPNLTLWGSSFAFYPSLKHKLYSLSFLYSHIIAYF